MVISNMDEPELDFDTLASDVKKICGDLRILTTTPGPTRCIAKLTEVFDQRIGRNREFPIYTTIREILDRMNKEDQEKGTLNLQVFEDYGNIMLISGFKEKPSSDEIQNIPVVLASHADEITFIMKKDSPQLLPIFNASPLANYGIMHHDVKIFGFREIRDERKFKEIGAGSLQMKKKIRKTDKKEEEIAEFYLEDVHLENSERKVKEGDMIVQNYDLTPEKYDLETIFHVKALDDRVGVLAHLYAMRELNRRGMKAKAIFVGDEEGVDKDIAWAKLARPIFRKYCKEENFIIICDGFDGKQLSEFKEEKEGEHLQEALIVPYRSEGKGAGDPGLFSLLRDYVIDLAKSHGFEAATTTDYVGRSFDPKIMDDFPSICSIDWSNGPVITPSENLFNVCHVDESVSIKQVINIIGTTFWTVRHLYDHIL